MHLRPFPLLLCPLGMLLGLALAAPAWGQTVIDYNFDDDEVEMDISVTVGPEVYTFSANLDFDDVDNLTEECLGVSVQFLDAAAVAAVNARLPRPSQQVDPAFPLLLRIEPPAVCGLRVTMLSDMRRSRSVTSCVNGLTETVVRTGFMHSVGSSHT